MGREGDDVEGEGDDIWDSGDEDGYDYDGDDDVI